MKPPAEKTIATNGACQIGNHDKCPRETEEYICGCECHIENWESDWDNLLSSMDGPTNLDARYLREKFLKSIQDMKEFICTLLARSLEEQRGRIEKELKEIPVFKVDTAGGKREIVLLDEVLQIIQNMK